MKVLRLLTLIIVLLTVLTAAPGVSAHRPVWGEGQLLEIENLTTSFAFYRELTSSSQVDVYAFEARAGEHLHAGINIPAISELESYGVSVALLGPGLPEADYTLLPADHPEGLGAIVAPSAPGEDFFEPFTQTNYWGRQRLDLSLPETGTYYLAIWNPDGATGKYVLDTGTVEVFSPLDLFGFPLWWVQVHLFFGHAPQMTAALVAVFMAIGAVAAIRRVHRLGRLRVTVGDVQ